MIQRQLFIDANFAPTMVPQCPQCRSTDLRPERVGIPLLEFNGWNLPVPRRFMAQGLCIFNLKPNRLLQIRPVLLAPEGPKFRGH